MDHRKKFAIIGVAGYIAPRHLQAIAATGHELAAAHDLSDSVGVLDRYFPEADFTTDPAAFARLLERRSVDCLTVCTPNYLHAAHVALALDRGIDAICEKPLGIDSRQLDRMTALERASGARVWTILQLRLHPEIVRLRERVAAAPSDRIYDIELTYVTPRGRWYAASWKGDSGKSGGVAMNIGIHFYDMLLWIFGPVERSEVHYADEGCVAGALLLRRARVRYLLSIDARHLPRRGEEGAAPYRRLSIDGEEFDFSQGFADLHTESYRRILRGEGFSPEDAREAVELLDRIGRTRPSGLAGECHPLARGLGRSVHPVSDAAARPGTDPIVPTQENDFGKTNDKGREDGD